MASESKVPSPITSSASYDNSRLRITSMLLDGNNYIHWAQAAKMYIAGHKKMGYITGTKKAPGETDPTYEDWNSENMLVMSWLVNSMEEHISRGLMFCKTAKEIWDSLSESYSQKQDLAQIYQLDRDSTFMRQNGMPIEEYWSKLRSKWEELDHYQPIPKTIEEMQKLREQRRVFDFLSGLDPENEPQRVQLLGRSVLPSLQVAYNYVRGESNRRGLNSSFVPVERSAMVVESKSQKGPPKKFLTPEERAKLKCTHCGKTRHTRDRCWELNPHLKPKDFKPRGPTAHNVTIEGEIVQKQDSRDQTHQAIHDLSQQLASLKASLQMDLSGTTASASANTVSTSSNSWVIDSGASDHMTGNQEGFVSLSPLNGHIKLADGSLSNLAGKGTFSIPSFFPLPSVLHVPKFPTNLLSVSSLTKNLNCSVTFFPTHCVFQDLRTRATIGGGHEENGLYLLNTKDIPSTYFSESHSDRTTLWHARLGHLPLNIMSLMFPNKFSNKTSIQCEVCTLAKHHRASYPVSNHHSSTIFELVHTDVWGPTKTASHFGFRYFISFIDDFSRTTWLYLMKSRDEVPHIVLQFHNMIATQFGVQIKTFRSDNAKEYMHRELHEFYANRGILYQTSCAYTPQQNGVAERKNRHLLDVTRSLLLGMNVPKSYWDEAILASTYLINRFPTKVLKGKSPLQVLMPNSPMFHIEPKVFGCQCFVHILGPSRDKLSAQSTKCVFLGYSPTQKGYKCYCPQTKKRFVSKDVTFFENVPYFGTTKDIDPTLPLPLVPFTPAEESPLSAPSTSDAPFKVYVRRGKQGVHPSLGAPSTDTSNSTEVSDEPELPIAVRKGTRSCTQHPIERFVSYHALSTPYKSFLSVLSSCSIPKTVADALADPQWKEAMLSEMDALERQHTWDLTDLPPAKHAVGCRWVFTVKYHPDGSIERYKARLVAKGYTQLYGVDYQETFSPVAKLTSVRVVLSIAANRGWNLYQLDVKNAFLHGELEEEVYMLPPPGFSPQGENRKVCKLKKAIYGLKQSPRAWFQRFSAAVSEIGFRRSTFDHSLFLKRENNCTTILIVYVDDIVLTGDNEDEIQKTKAFLGRAFDIKDLGNLRYFLGIEVARSKKGIFISQRKYALDVLKDTGMLGTRPADSPIEYNHGLHEKESDFLDDPGRFQRLVGRLIYLTVTRPDISYAVSIISQFMHKPCKHHLEAAYKILRYLKKAPGKGILYGSHGNTEICGYCDADWAGSKSDRRSTSGYFTFVGGNLVSWKSKKQNTVARSSAEAEYRAMAVTTCELLWLNSLMTEMGFHTKSMRLFCDSQAAIHIAANPVFHERTKHIEIDCHFVREKVVAGIINTPFIRTNEQLADILTKGSVGKHLHNTLIKLGMYDIHAPLEGEC